MKAFIPIFLLLLVWNPRILMAQEHYNYTVKYGFIKAGHARLEFDQIEQRLQSRFTIQSSRWLSRLWKMDDAIESTYNLTTGELLTHKKRIREGKYKRDYQVTFDWQDSLISINDDQQVMKHARLKDIPSLLYHMRGVPLEVGDTLFYTLFDGRSTGRLSLHIQAMEHIHVDGNKIPAYELRPLERSEKAEENDLFITIWLSVKEPHIPVQLSIDTRYGDAVMTLQHN
ncbi:MAG: DUF3108 domain-containing protein [Candidatus Marinimicrobia bacterium]|nr:DUF3108 domain-containing protein [Candidatus Neomarinimicrobiota bacterium]MCF7839260.1 DUF3108 domain-containing protein [Candidatus Neomarinimicrobiota bacterium]MCF7902208.1 DUF3108 domain-containing protein [Candidatus Neomarinimicrobiota bacterium]